MMASESGTTGLVRSWSLRCNEADLCVTMETFPMTYEAHPVTSVAQSAYTMHRKSLGLNFADIFEKSLTIFTILLILKDD